MYHLLRYANLTFLRVFQAILCNFLWHLLSLLLDHLARYVVQRAEHKKQYSTNDPKLWLTIRVCISNAPSFSWHCANFGLLLIFAWLDTIRIPEKSGISIYCEDKGSAWSPHAVEHQGLVKQSVRSTFVNWVYFWPQSPFLSSSKRMWISRSPCRSCKDIIDIRICVAQGQQQGTVLKRDLIEFSNLLSSDYAPIQSVQQCRCLTAFKCQMPNACNLPKFAKWVKNGPTIRSDSFRPFVYVWSPKSKYVISI